MVLVFTSFVYTYVLTDGIERFDWDAANVSHICVAVTPHEVEEVVNNLHVEIPGQSVDGEPRWKLFGRTEAGRYLVVVFTIRRSRFRTVTAY